jgi:hypothetical protein
MDNVQNCDSYINIPWSQTCRIEKGLEGRNCGVKKVLSQLLLLRAEENYENLQDICSLPILELPPLNTYSRTMPLLDSAWLFRHPNLGDADLE